MKLRNLLLPAMALAVSAVPIKADAQASFDCRRASHATEIAICNDPELALMDQQMDETFRAVLARQTDRETLRSSQRAWLADVRLCDADATCIYRTYEDRLRDLVRLDVEETDEQPEAIAEPSQAQAMPSSTTEASQVRQMDVPNVQTAPDSAQASSTASQSDATDSKAVMAVGGIILGLIVLLLIAVGATKALADYTAARFGWPMVLNWWNVLHLISIFAFLGAFSVGAPMAGVVIAGGLWLIVLFVNIRKTNLLVGLTMTVLQPLVVFIMWAIYGAMKSKAEGRRA